MVGIALAMRLVAMAYLYPLQLNPQQDFWPFGFETGRIARSIATGHGFANPLFTNTGPTAWMTPVYPYILAGIFLAFGVFTKTSALVILAFNAITSALTCVPIFFFARRSLGERVGEWAGWIWAIFPYSIYWPVQRIWDTWLATLLLAILFWLALALAESTRVRKWIAYGALSGVAALTEPAVMAVLPFLALWALWRCYRVSESGIDPRYSQETTAVRTAGITSRNRVFVRLFLCGLSCALAAIFVISPWFIRNRLVFHEFIPFRDNFELALRVGNIGDTRHMLTLQAGPWLNEAEWHEFQKYGEIPYMREKGVEARAYIAAHKSEYIDSSLRRFVYIWTHFWPLPPDMMAGFEPDPAEIFLFTGLTILAAMGLVDGFRRKAPGIAAYAIVLALFPVVYYITSLEPWYRVPIDPIIMALAANALASRIGATKLLNGYSRVNSTSHVEYDSVETT